MTVRKFRTLEEEGLKAAAVFNKSPTQWKKIRDEVKDFVWSNWERWIEEKPAWFDQQMRSRIPRDMIPTLEEARRYSSRRLQSLDLELGLGGQGSGFNVFPHDLEPALQEENGKTSPRSSKAAQELLAIARRGEGRSVGRT